MWIKQKLDDLFDDPQKARVARLAAAAALIFLVLAAVVAVVHESRVSRRVVLDTAAVPLAARLAKINTGDRYYDKRVRDKCRDFYRRNAMAAKWLGLRRPAASYRAFLAGLREAEQYGLDPDQYDLRDLEASVDALYADRNRSRDAVADLDLAVTASFFLFTTHLIEGRIRTAGYGEKIWLKNPPDRNDVALLLASQGGNIEAIIDALHPPHAQYKLMREALMRYRQYAGEPTARLAASIAVRTIRPGQRDTAVPRIRARLALTDLKPYTPDDSMVYDDRLVAGVRSFQERHGLPTDGVISQETLRYLNQSFRQKADLIELNLERIRWLPREMPREYITINVPEYYLRVVSDGKVVLGMKVVAGDEYNATPVFNDSLEYIVFSPTWTVPPGIMEEEVIPNLRANPLAYDTTRFTIFRNGSRIDPTAEDWNAPDLDPRQYQLVESPGESNSLGLVKFMMPNDLNIYLHDTPADHLFRQRKRAFSHGCIRLEDPMKMTRYLLQDQPQWTEEKVLKAMAGDDPKTARLKRKIPVQIEYRTVWVDDKGRVHFREDLYDHDKQQLKKLKRLESKLENED